MSYSRRRPSALWHLYEEGTATVADLRALTGWRENDVRGTLQTLVRSGMAERCLPASYPMLWRLTAAGKAQAAEVDRAQVDFAAAAPAEIDVAQEIEALMALPQYAGPPKVLQATQLQCALGAGGTVLLNLLDLRIVVQLGPEQSHEVARYLTAANLLDARPACGGAAP